MPGDTSAAGAGDDGASTSTGLSSLTGATRSSSGRGSTAGGRGGRGRNNRGGRGNHRTPRTEVRFHGRIDDIKGHIYDITDPDSMTSA